DPLGHCEPACLPRLEDVSTSVIGKGTARIAGEDEEAAHRGGHASTNTAGTSIGPSGIVWYSLGGTTDPMPAWSPLDLRSSPSNGTIAIRDLILQAPSQVDSGRELAITGFRTDLQRSRGANGAEIRARLVRTVICTLNSNSPYFPLEKTSSVQRRTVA